MNTGNTYIYTYYSLFEGLTITWCLIKSKIDNFPFTISYAEVDVLRSYTMNKLPWVEPTFPCCTFTMCTKWCAFAVYIKLIWKLSLEVISYLNNIRIFPRAHNSQCFHPVSRKICLSYQVFRDWPFKSLFPLIKDCGRVFLRNFWEKGKNSIATSVYLPQNLFVQNLI